MPDDPQEPGAYDWSSHTFRMLEDNELFWINKNESYRKMSDNTALNLKEQKVISISPNARVYQKEY